MTAPRVTGERLYAIGARMWPATWAHMTDRERTAEGERITHVLDVLDVPALTAQRDALLAACDGLLDAVRDCGYYDPGTMGQAVRDARAAIAQVRGVAK